jgi:peptide/nickel transport system permease protein
VSDVALPTPRTTTRRRVRRWWSFSVVLSGLWLGMVLVMVVTGSLLAPHPPDSQDLLAGLSGPSSGHLLGTDELGRDILSRVIAGARQPVIGALAIALGAMFISTTFGLVAGYLGGFTEAFTMRTVDLLLALPALLVIIVIVGSFNGGYPIAVALLALLAAPWDTRIVRSVTLEQRPRAYVEAARVMGISSPRILVSHILPNVLPLIVVNLALDFTYGLVSLAGLSFVGLGVNPGAADWGRMLFENRDLLNINPWAALAPAIVILLTAAAANIVGDWAFERIDARGRAR